MCLPGRASPNAAPRASSRQAAATLWACPAQAAPSDSQHIKCWSILCRTDAAGVEIAVSALSITKILSRESMDPVHMHSSLGAAHLLDDLGSVCSDHCRADFSGLKRVGLVHRADSALGTPVKHTAAKSLIQHNLNESERTTGANGEGGALSWESGGSTFFSPRRSARGR